MRARVLNSQIWVPQQREEVFHFFANARNLDSITPPWLKFQILNPDEEICKGAMIEYRLRVHGIPVAWKSKITTWDPPALFVDEQVEGPYKEWIHEHRFLQDSGGTLILDHVKFRVPGWIFEPWVYHLAIGPDLEKIFSFRREWLGTHFKAPGGDS